MTSHADLDAILRGWLSEGAEYAPEMPLRHALEATASMPQRRSVFGLPRSSSARLTAMRIGLIAGVAILAVLIAVGIGVQTGIIRLPEPEPSTPIEPSDALQRISPADSGIAFSYPEGWELVDERAFELWRYDDAGTGGQMTISFGSGLHLRLCLEECADLLFDMPVPYSAERAAEIIAAEASSFTRVAGWDSLPGSAVPGLEAGLVQRIEAVDAAGIARRDVVVVGVFMGRAVAVTWSQPTDAFDTELLDDVLAGIFLDPAGPGYATGDLVPYTDHIGGYALSVPDHWYAAPQPTIGERPASGVRRFGQPELSELTISLGDPDGSLRLCDATCIEVAPVTSPAELDAAVTDWLPQSPGQTEERGGIDVDGVDARFIRREVPDASGSRTYYAAYGAQDGRPFVLAFDVTSGAVTIEGIQEIVDSFSFLAPSISGDQTFSAADASFELTLGNTWRVREGPDPSAVYLLRGEGAVRLSARAGDAGGQIQTCDAPAGPWEVCRSATATTLDDLEAAVAIQPVDDHGVGPPTPVIDSVVLDGQPARLIHIQAYEYPARGGQVVAYLIAVHDGRPFVIRLWTDRNELAGVDEVLAGFRFGD